MHHSRLEGYLDAVEQQLTRLPGWEREAWREEARQHLTALTEAREELGWSSEEAVEASLRQFGEPERLGQELLACSSVALQERQISGYVGWSLHVLSWNVAVTLITMNALLALPTLELGTSAPTAVLFLLGHAAGGAVLGRKVRNRRFQGVMNVAYLLLLGAGMMLTGLVDAWPATTFLGAWGMVLAGLALSGAAASWTGRPAERHESVAPSG